MLNSYRTSLEMTESLKQISETEALSRLSSLCARSEYCIFDMRRKMQKWDLTPEAKERIISTLLKERFIDEARYAKAFTRDKFRYNHWGTMKIAQELRRRHISDDDIEAARQEVSSKDSKNELRRLIEAKSKTVKAKSEYEKRAKLFRYAMSKGFLYDEIMEILNSP